MPYNTSIVITYEIGKVGWMISIIVPVYKSEKYLRDCVQSILAQTYTDFELILIDDGSPDNSGDMCDQFAKMDHRISVLHKQNQGVSAARNDGLELAKGEYLCFVDSDDCIEESYLSVLAQDMRKGGLSACKLNRTGEAFLSDCKEVMSPKEAQISCFSYYGMFGFPWGRLYDAEIIRTHHLRFAQDIAICEDVLFMTQYLKYASNHVVWNHSTLYFYRINQEGAKTRFRSHENFNRRELTEIDALERCKQYLLDGKEIEKAWKVRTAKAAVNTIRIMTANQVHNHEMKKRLLRIVRENLIHCLISKYLNPSAKISILTCSFSPRLEKLLWESSKGKKSDLSRKTE